MKIKIFFPTLAAIFVFVFLGSGCSLTKKPKISEKTKLAAEKKKKYTQLYQELSQGILKPGTTAAAIKEKFGEPDDIFKSGSSTSTFDVWTYDRILANQDQPVEGISILLYFNDGRLVTWKY